MRSGDRRPSRTKVGIALGELDKFSEKLSVPDAVADEAICLCMRALERGLTRGRKLAQFIAASLYTSCRVNGVPTTLDDVTAISRVDRGDIARCYRLLVRELDLEMPVADPAEYVARVAFKANVSPEVVTDAQEILSKATKAGITAGVYPPAIAASAIYLASMLNGQNMTQDRIAIAAEVQEATVRKQSKRIRKILRA